eukprot:scaffold222291_cov36-Cyclotella_meneghiniana.AAC.1
MESLICLRKERQQSRLTSLLPSTRFLQTVPFSTIDWSCLEALFLEDLDFGVESGHVYTPRVFIATRTSTSWIGTSVPSCWGMYNLNFGRSVRRRWE